MQSDQRTRLHLALYGYNKSRRHRFRLAFRQKPALAQGIDRGVKFFSLRFGDLSQLSLIGGLVAPHDGKALHRLPGHFLLRDAEPVRNQLVPRRWIEPVHSVARYPPTVLSTADENNAIAIQLDEDGRAHLRIVFGKAVRVNLWSSSGKLAAHGVSTSATSCSLMLGFDRGDRDLQLLFGSRDPASHESKIIPVPDSAARFRILRQHHRCDPRQGADG